MPWRHDESEGMAMSQARLAAQKIDQHIVDCSARYEALRAETRGLYETLRMDMERRHGDNQRRSDTQDKALAKIFYTMLSGLAAVVVLAAQHYLSLQH